MAQVTLPYGAWQIAAIPAAAGAAPAAFWGLRALFALAALLLVALPIVAAGRTRRLAAAQARR